MEEKTNPQINTQKDSPSILERVMKVSFEEKKAEFDPQRAMSEASSVLRPKERQVIYHRFSLDNGIAKTLEEIGELFKLSRERVRQIEKSAQDKLSLFSKKQNSLHEAYNLIASIIDQKGGIISEGELLEELSLEALNKINKGFIKLILNIGEDFVKIKKTKSISKAWALRYKPLHFLEEIIKVASEILNSKNKPLGSEDLLSAFRESSFFSKNRHLVSEKFILATLKISPKIISTKEGDWGLESWPEVNPKNIKDKSYYVLKRYKKPAHFRKITELIEKEFKKETKPEVVHNELVKNKRFVLIGRGIYGLSEWGFKPGTVAKVIEGILKKEEKPLIKEEIIKRVLEIRQVALNTILLNLQKEKFEKIKKGKSTFYRLRNCEQLAVNSLSSQ